MTRVRRILFVLLLTLLLSAAAAALAAVPPEPGTVVTGYFTDVKYLRPEMKATWVNVDKIPPYTIIEIRVVRGFWGEATYEKGVPGYLNFQDLRPVPVPEPCEPYQAYSTEKIPLRAFPEIKLKSEEFLPARTLVTVDGTIGNFLCVTLPDGQTRYVPVTLLKKAEFTPKEVPEKRICVGADTELLEFPLSGAAKTGLLTPGVIYRTAAESGDYYYVTADGVSGYVWKGHLKIWARSPGDGQLFFRDPRLAGARDGVEAEDLYTAALAGPEGALVYAASDRTFTLSPEERIYAYTAYGGFCAISAGTRFGYVLRDQIHVPDRADRESRIRAQDLSGASLQANPFLDQALPMLEEGNPFLLRYNAITGSELEPLFPLGVPYFWGGRGYNVLVERWPDYTVREAWQSSLVFYHKGTNYVFGFDCIGFVKNIYRMAGWPIKGSVEDLGNRTYCDRHHVFCSDARPLPRSWEETAAALQPGDLLYVRHPNTHVMICIGTLRAWGYTEEQLPALADALDCPLMIHCGENPMYYFRFRNMLSQQQSGLLSTADPTDGGVAVCIIGPKPGEEEMIIEAHDTKSRCYDVEGACVTLFNFKSVKSYFVYRPTVIERGAEPSEDAEAEPSEEGGDAPEEDGDPLRDPEALEDPEEDVPGKEQE